ncbi:MAG: hypothetical protein AAF909_10670 [Pseudomonadota bacterium]
MVDAHRAPGARPARQSFLGIWREQIGKAARQPYLLALLIGSALLSAASFFTTFDGMLNFMPVWPVTFCIVFAIQALLFVASWRLGFAAADREAPPVFTAFVFLICLGTSVFFSWVSLFSAINDPATQARTAETRMHRAVEEAVVATQDRAEATRLRLGAALLDERAYVQWMAEIDAVARGAMGARETLDAAREAEADRLATQLREVAAEGAALRRATATSESRSEAARRRAEQLERSRPELVERVRALQEAADAAQIAMVRKEGEMNAEERGGVSGGGAGRGPVWRALRDEKAVLEAELETKERLLSTAADRLGETDAEIERLRIEIAATGVEDADSAKQGLLEARRAQLQERAERLSVGEAGDVAGEVAALRADLARFETSFDIAFFDAAAARCEILLDNLKSVGASQPGGAMLSCARDAIATPVAALRRAAEASAAVVAQCVVGGASAPVISEMTFADGVAHGRACAALSGLPASELTDVRAALDRLTLEEADDASAFVKTVNAWRDGDKLSYFALGIALFIDILVLLSGLIGAVSVTSEMGRAFGRGFAKRDIEDARRALSLKSDDPFAIARTILNIVEPTEDSRHVGEVRIDAAPADLQGGVRQFLLLQTEKRLAERKKPKRGAPAPGGGALVFLVKKRVLAALRAYLEETEIAQEEAARRRAEAISDDLDFVLQHLGPADRRGETLEAAFQALRPPSETPNPGQKGGLKAVSAWLAPRMAGELRFPSEPDAAAADRWPEIRRLCFALYRRGLAVPMAAAGASPQGAPLAEPAETPGYLLTERALALLEHASQLDERREAGGGAETAAEAAATLQADRARVPAEATPEPEAGRLEPDLASETSDDVREAIARYAGPLVRAVSPANLARRAPAA